MSATRQPRKFSDQACANMAAAHRGLTHSQEHRQAIADACRPEAIARASSAALEAINHELEELGAVKLTDALETRGIDYATGYEWATYRRSGRLRPPVFRGPRRILCVRDRELDAELEQWRCRRVDAGVRCPRYALLSNTGLCHAHRVVDVLREYRTREYAAARGHKDVLLAADVAAKIGVTRPYLTRLVARGRLAPEWRDVAGIRVMVFRPADVRHFQRDRPVNHWHDREWVERQVLDRGWVDARAAAVGIPRSQALEQFLAAVEARRRRPGGRPPRGDAPGHHHEWLKRFLAIRENHESHAYGGAPMPSFTQLCIEAAFEDSIERPERWPDYAPADLPTEAGARVRRAIKPLLIAGTETLGS